MSHFDLLKSCPIFLHLNDAEMILLEKSCQEVQLGQNEVLHHRGDVSKGFCLLKAGSMQVGDIKNSILKPGDFTGTFSLFKNGLKAKLTLNSLEPSALLCLSSQSFFALGQDSPEIQHKIAYGVVSEYIADIDSIANSLVKA